MNELDLTQMDVADLVAACIVISRKMEEAYRVEQNPAKTIELLETKTRFQELGKKLASSLA